MLLPSDFCLFRAFRGIRRYTRIYVCMQVTRIKYSYFLFLLSSVGNFLHRRVRGGGVFDDEKQTKIFK